MLHRIPCALEEPVVDLVKPSMSKPHLDSFCVMRPSPSISNISNTKPWHDSMWKSLLVILPLHDIKTSNPARHSVLEPHAASGWRIHYGVEVTELSTNKQHTLSACHHHLCLKPKS
jgi:hypothetical protein